MLNTASRNGTTMADAETMSPVSVKEATSAGRPGSGVGVFPQPTRASMIKHAAEMQIAHGFDLLVLHADR